MNKRLLFHYFFIENIKNHISEQHSSVIKLGIYMYLYIIKSENVKLCVIFKKRFKKHLILLFLS